MNCLRWLLGLALLVAMSAAPVDAAVTFTTTHTVDPRGLDDMMSSTDAIQGLIAQELSGDRGWHDANPASLDPLHPFGLPAFTDGLGSQGSFYGLLNDFPPADLPTKYVQYDLPGPTDITAINIFTGNVVNSDGRIFSTSFIRYSMDMGQSFQDLGYFQSDPSGTINNETTPGVTPNAATMVSIFDDVDAMMLTGVTNLQIELYGVDNSQGQMRDPFDFENPYTGIDDGLTGPNTSPIVWEIDVLTSGGEADADFDGDGDVDGADFLAWQRGLGTTGNATAQQGDSDGDMDVDAADLANWRSQFSGGGGVAAVPEPTSLAMLVVGALLPLGAKRRRRVR